MSNSDWTCHHLRWWLKIIVAITQTINVDYSEVGLYVLDLDEMDESYPIIAGELSPMLSRTERMNISDRCSEILAIFHEHATVLLFHSDTRTKFSHLAQALLLILDHPQARVTFARKYKLDAVTVDVANMVIESLNGVSQYLVSPAIIDLFQGLISAEM